MHFSLKLRQMSYGERLLALDMLPLAYDREIRDLVFFYKAVTAILIQTLVIVQPLKWYYDQNFPLPFLFGIGK